MYHSHSSSRSTHPPSSSSRSVNITSSSYSSIDCRKYSINPVTASYSSVLLSPMLSADSSYKTKLDDSSSAYQSSQQQSPSMNYSYHPPQLHPHQRFLNRSEENCPSTLTGSKRTKWLKTGKKARENQQLTLNTAPFHWSNSHYDEPIYIHYLTPESIVNSSVQKITNVTLFTIDTESDKSTPERPHSLPALIQIQAIHDEEHATVFLIETQHLPEQSSGIFKSIQHLCRTIFSPKNKIMAWGDVVNELRPFTQFKLFDISQVTNVLNLQQYFTNEWNKHHPHTPDCLARQSTFDDSESDEHLICNVNSDDVDEDLQSMGIYNDFNTCICPKDVRPYKSKGAQWSLQKAVQFIFNRALDKEMTINLWSYGLDDRLNKWTTNSDQRTQKAMTLYAINDLFAPTHLFFYLGNLKFSKSVIGSTLQASSSSSLPSTIPDFESSTNSSIVMPSQTIRPPSFFVLADSHAKHVNPMITTPHYSISTKSISGLKWLDERDTALCARALILSPSISPILSCSTAILLLIATNSVRIIPAQRIIEQVAQLINTIRLHHPHLRNTRDIAIVASFPTYKLTRTFPTQFSLTSNITSYNEQLKYLSEYMNFTFVDFEVIDNYLGNDLMHLHPKYHNFVSDSITNYFDEFIRSIPTLTSIIINPNQQTTTQQTSDQQHIPSQSQQRSREAVARRNKRRYEKLRVKQQQHTIKRKICTQWTLQDIKKTLEQHHIRYTRLPPSHNNTLRIQFNNQREQDHAEATLPADVFSEANLNSRIRDQQQ